MNIGSKCTKLVAFIVALAMIPLSAQTVPAEEPELTDSWAATYDKGTFRHGMFGDFSGDSADDFMAIYSEGMPNMTGEYETFMILFDGQDGSVVWEKNYTNGLEPLLIVRDVEMDGDVNALVYMTELTEVPVSNTDYNYTIMMSAMSMIEGETGDVLWTSSNMGTMDARTVTIEGEDMILAGGISTFNMYEGGLYTINPENGHYRPTGIDYDTWRYNFLIEELPNGDDAVIVYGNQAIEAYEFGTWNLIWEYDFFDNDVYFSAGHAGLLEGDGTVAFHAGKGDAYNSLIVIDTATGEEKNAFNLSETGLTYPTYLWAGNLNGDGTADYLALGFVDGNYSLMAIDGTDISELWRIDGEGFIGEPEGSTIEILDADGTDDVLLTLDARVFTLVGETGEVIWEDELAAEPEYIVWGNRQDGSKNLAYLNGDTLYCMNLDIPRSSNMTSIIVVSLLAIAVVAMVAFVVIKRR